MNVHFTSNGDELQRYRKSALVPGEPSIPGDGRPLPAATSFGQVASIVCFDEDFPEVVRSIHGSQSGKRCTFLANSVNDWEAVQHERLLDVLISRG